MSDEHSCKANLTVDVDQYYHDEEVPIISGIITVGGASIYMTCSECGQQFDVEYELVEAVPV